MAESVCWIGVFDGCFGREVNSDPVASIFYPTISTYQGKKWMSATAELPVFLTLNAILFYCHKSVTTKN